MLARLIDDHVQRRGLPSDAHAEAPYLGVALTDAAPTEPVTTDPTHEITTDPVGNGEATAQLRQLDDLHRAGVLSDDEYHRAKRRVDAP